LQSSTDVGKALASGLQLANSNLAMSKAVGQDLAADMTCGDCHSQQTAYVDALSTAIKSSGCLSVNQVLSQAFARATAIGKADTFSQALASASGVQQCIQVQASPAPTTATPAAANPAPVAPAAPTVETPGPASPIAGQTRTEDPAQATPKPSTPVPASTPEAMVQPSPSPIVAPAAPNEPARAPTPVPSPSPSPAPMPQLSSTPSPSSTPGQVPAASSQPNIDIEPAAAVRDITCGCPKSATASQVLAEAVAVGGCGVGDNLIASESQRVWGGVGGYVSCICMKPVS
jgi:outer membrane biosynthesis protein TonB